MLGKIKILKIKQIESVKIINIIKQTKYLHINIEENKDSKKN